MYSCVVFFFLTSENWNVSAKKCVFSCIIIVVSWFLCCVCVRDEEVSGVTCFPPIPLLKAALPNECVFCRLLAVDVFC